MSNFWLGMLLIFMSSILSKFIERFRQKERIFLRNVWQGFFAVCFTVLVRHYDFESDLSTKLSVLLGDFLASGISCMLGFYVSCLIFGLYTGEWSTTRQELKKENIDLMRSWGDFKSWLWRDVMPWSLGGMLTGGLFFVFR